MPESDTSKRQGGPYARMKNDTMKAVVESLDRDLAFEVADVMIDEASINGHAFHLRNTVTREQV